MSQGVNRVTLNRDGAATPWGFRLHGGRDIGVPLAIQRVFLGSPSENELHRGDIILQIGNHDAGNLAHMEAHDLIKAAGNTLQLVVHRLPGAPQSPGAASPSFMGSGHPLANVTSSSPTPMKASSFQPMHAPKPTPPPEHPSSQAWSRPGDYCGSPLPTTPLPMLHDYHPLGNYSPYSPQRVATSEALELHQEKSREKAAIVHQGYRTFPLISPKPKALHDYPVGSYLRHVQDPSWKGRSTAPHPKPFVVSYLPTQQQQQSSAPSGAPWVTSEGSNVVNRQYNTPLKLYSEDAVARTITEQTGMHPKNKSSAATPRILSTQSPNPGPSGPLSPRAAAAAAAAAGGSQPVPPAKPGTKLQNIVDITLSPTFQLIQEAENRSVSPRPESRTPPTMSRSPAPGAVPRAAPNVDSQWMNTFGGSKEVIHQSGSFKTLMATLAMTGQQEF